MTRVTSQSSQEKLLIFNFIRNEYDNNKTNGYNVPYVIKLLIIEYAERIFSKILTIKQDLDFYSKIKSKISFDIKKIELKFRASEYEFSAHEFHKICDNNFIPYANICIIKSTIGNIFGGFTKLSWNDGNLGDDIYAGYKDEDSFLFIIKYDDDKIQQDCPLILHKKSRKFSSICYDKNCGPVYGRGWDCSIGDKCDKQVDIDNYDFIHEFGSDDTQTWEYIVDWRNKPKYQSVNFSKLENYYNEDHEEITSLCGGPSTFYEIWNGQGETYNLFDVEEYEVFEIK